MRDFLQKLDLLSPPPIISEYIFEGSGIHLHIPNLPSNPSVYVDGTPASYVLSANGAIIINKLSSGTHRVQIRG